MKKMSLYIHIPFCVRKCGYCDFISFDYNKEDMTGYMNDLNKEIQYYGQEYNYPIHTIFIGGGTPSLMTGDEMHRLMQSLEQNFDLSECVEISMESNPGTLTKKKVAEYKAAGINRISMGVQTLNNDTLKSLDRIHDVQAVYDSVEAINASGIVNYNMDLMFGLPGQTMNQLSLTVDRMIELNPAHISAYSLKFEEGTDFYRRLEKGEIEAFEDELDRDMYCLIIDKLSKAGYDQYEISNFSKAGYTCEHNMVYWEKKPYLGLGVGAHSYMDNERFFNANSLEEYKKLVDESQHSIVGREAIDYSDDLFEYIILNLRLNKGLSLVEVNHKYDLDFISKYSKEIDKLEKDDLIEKATGHIKLTPKGRDLSNQVFIAFLD